MTISFFSGGDKSSQSAPAETGQLICSLHAKASGLTPIHQYYTFREDRMVRNWLGEMLILKKGKNRTFQLLCLYFAVVLGMSAEAQESVTDEFRIMITDGREVVVLPSATTSMRIQSELGPINGRSYETTSQRVHIILFDEEVFRASTPLEGKSSRIVFVPFQRKFAQLLPSIRVELEDYAKLDSISKAIGAEKAAFFEKLGFSIIDLPDTVHPVWAIEQLEKLPEQPKASIRIRGPRVKWR